MLLLHGSVRILLASEPVDMRNGIDGLAAIVQGAWREDAYAGHYFVFVSRRRDSVKILTWDNGGFVVFHKRLEAGRFRRLVALLRDPGGAVVALAPRASTPPRADVVWHVLNGTEMERTSGAYCELLGWRRTERLVLPRLGAFHRFAWEASGPVVGAFVDITGLPGRHAHWLFHFRVEHLDAAMEAAQTHGSVVLPPVEVPSGHRIAVCEDAQGAAFALREDPR